MTNDPRIDTLERFRADAKDQLKDIHKTLYGNGQPGWDEMLRDIQKRLVKVETEISNAGNNEKEYRLMGMKVSAENRLAIINGGFILFGIILTWYLHR